ncbi:MAG: helix-turn-helix domain-containing protein [Bacilli bacterium]
MNIGEKIKLIRTTRGLKQAEFVRGCYSNTYLSRIENGHIQPSREFLDFVSETYEIQSVFFQDEQVEKDSVRILEITKMFQAQQTISEQDLLFLQLHKNLTYASIVRLNIYSTLITTFLEDGYTEKAIEIKDEAIQVYATFMASGASDDELAHYYYAIGEAHMCAGQYRKAFVMLRKAISTIDPSAHFVRGRLYRLLAQTANVIGILRSTVTTWIHASFEALHAAETTITTRLHWPTIQKERFHLQRLSLHHFVYAKEYEQAYKYFWKNEQIVVQLRELEELHTYDRAVVHLMNRRDAQAEELLNYFMRDLMDEALRKECLLLLINIAAGRKNWPETTRLVDQLTQLIDPAVDVRLYIQLQLMITRIHLGRSDYWNYERTMKLLIVYIETHQLWGVVASCSMELAEHFNRQRVFKQASLYFQMFVNSQTESNRLTDAGDVVFQRISVVI